MSVRAQVYMEILHILVLFWLSLSLLKVLLWHRHKQWERPQLEQKHVRMNKMDNCLAHYLNNEEDKTC